MLFRAEYRDLIRAGRKRTTLRARPPRVRPGQRVTAWAGRVGDPAARLTLLVEAVDAVPLEALTDADARVDGLPDRAALLAALRACYPDGLPRTLTRVRFVLVE